MANNTIFELEINKKYSLTTKKKTYVSQNVLVVGIINYNETNSTGVDVLSLGNDEHFFGNEPEIMYDLKYYKCLKLDNNGDPTTKILIVWADIIDPNLSNILESNYKFEMGMKIPSTTKEPIDTIRNDLIVYLKTKYNIDATINMTYDEIDRSAIELLREKVKKYEEILEGFTSLKVLVPVLEAINNNELLKRISDIEDSTEIIKEQLSNIVTGLS